MKRAVVAFLFLSLAVGACSPETRRAAGVVVSVDQESLAEVRSFKMRTQTGETLTFRVGNLDLSAGGFPANHLREHMATVTPVVVEYIDEAGEHLAVRLTDAP